MGFVKFVRVQWDRVAGALCIVAGAVALVVGWAQVSRSVYPAAQFPYLLSCGVGGLFLLGVGATLWLSADLRDEWRHLDTLADRVAARLDTRPADEATRNAPSASADFPAARPVAVRGGS